MSDKIINWDLDSFPLQDVLKCLEHQIIVERICRNQEKFNSEAENSGFIPVFFGWNETDETRGVLPCTFGNLETRFAWHMSRSVIQSKSSCY